jgi:hypothetical protein
LDWLFGTAAVGVARALNTNQSHQHHQQQIPGLARHTRTVMLAVPV